MSGGRLDTPLPIRLVYTKEEAQQLNEELLGQPLYALDTETYEARNEVDDEGEEEDANDREDLSKSPVNNGLVISAQFSWRLPEGLTRVFMLNYGDEYGGNLDVLAPALGARIPKILHNASYDSHTIMNHGITLAGPLWDTMVEVFNLDQNRKYKGGYGLKACAKDYLGRQRRKYDDVFGKVKLRKDGQPYATMQKEVPRLDEYLELTSFAPPPSWPEVEANGRAEYEAWYKDRWVNNRHWEMSYWGKWYNFLIYATNDTWDCYSLHECCRAQYERLPWGNGTYWDFFEHFESCVTDELIIALEREGMLLDRPFLRGQRTRCEKDLEDLKCKINEWAGCPIEAGKAKQLAMLLHGTGMQPIYASKTNQYKGGPRAKVAFYIPGKGIPVLDTTKGGEPSTSAESLNKLVAWATEEGRSDLDGLEHIIAHGKADKQKGTYLEGMVSKCQDWYPTDEERVWLNELGWSDEYLASLDYGRLHTTIRQIGASSGRWASRGPNLMNITTGGKDSYHLRDAFIAPPGYVVYVVDFANLEYRLLAHFTADPLLIQAFTNGYDMHSLTAYNVFPEVKAEVDKHFASSLELKAQKWIKEHFEDLRDKKAKILNFEIIYGVGPTKLAMQLKITKDEAWRLIQGWFKTYAGVRPWQQRVLAGARQTGYVKTLMGRYRFADTARLDSNEKWIRGEEERTLGNAVIQGSAKDICVKAMLNIARNQRLKELGYRMANQIHDEILGYTPIGTEEEVGLELDKCCIDPFGKKLRIPMPISRGYGASWATAKH